MVSTRRGRWRSVSIINHSRRLALTELSRKFRSRTAPYPRDYITTSCCEGLGASSQIVDPGACSKFRDMEGDPWHPSRASRDTPKTWRRVCAISSCRSVCNQTVVHARYMYWHPSLDQATCWVLLSKMPFVPHRRRQKNRHLFWLPFCAILWSWLSEQACSFFLSVKR